MKLNKIITLLLVSFYSVMIQAQTITYEPLQPAKFNTFGKSSSNYLKASDYTPLNKYIISYWWGGDIRKNFDTALLINVNSKFDYL